MNLILIVEGPPLEAPVDFEETAELIRREPDGSAFFGVLTDPELQ